ncbi:MAG TPA: DUF1631 family protein, partial [Noviherbaspirillum sp.]|nr:DUF1631 family protein [Noviherbaspirillum sp.]
MKSPVPGGRTAPLNDASRARMQALISVALRNSVAALDGFTRRLASALSEAARTAPAPAALALRQAVVHLEREPASFHTLFADCLRQAFEQEVQLLHARTKSRLRSGALDLSLDNFDAMQRKVQIDNHAQAFDRANAARLAAVHARLAQLLGREPAGLSNPFRAELFLGAAASAWQRFEAEPEAQRVFLQQLGPAAFLPLDAILDAVDAELRERSAGAAPMPASSPRALLEAERQALMQGGRTLDRAFAHLARTAALPPATLELLALLQPVLRMVAQADGRFIVNPRHPGRRLVQLVVQASLAVAQGSDAARALEAALHAIAARLASDRGNAALDAACKEVDAILAPLLQAVADRRDACIADATQQEREARAEKIARDEVLARLEGGTVPEFVESFLLEQWTRVLAAAQNGQIAKPAMLANLVQAMDELIWSVQAKEPHERAQLQERLPALIALLNAWLNVVKWEGAAREAFFARLARRHAELARGEAVPDARGRLQQSLDATERASEHELRRRADELA